jgi:hypothetical protein
MKRLSAIAILIAVLVASPAHAGQAEVRAVAIDNNCPPKKIEIYKQALGATNGTIYRVQCVLPKTVGAADNAPKPLDAILVNCQQSMCDMLRPIEMDKK